MKIRLLILVAMLTILGCQNPAVRASDTERGQGAEDPIYGKYVLEDISNLSFKEHGGVLLARLPVTINNSDHLIQSFYQDTGDSLKLFYLVLQNRDRMNRSRKRVVVEWDLGRRPVPDHAQVAGCHAFLQNSQLKNLLKNP